MKIISGGKLRIYTQLGNLTYEAPNAFKVDSFGNSTSVACNWHIASNIVSFAFPSGYSSHLPLIIIVEQGTGTSIAASNDNLNWSTYCGGATTNTATGFFDVKTDNTGKFYVTGYAAGAGLPISTGVQPSPGGITDWVILKFNANGSQSWATYYGGSGDDNGFSIATDNSGNIFVTGYASAGFPTFNPGGGVYYDGTISGSYDIGIVKLNPTGTAKLWATYYGDVGSEYGYDLAFDKYENVYIVGRINGTSNPTLLTQTGGYNSSTGQGIILKFNTNGTPLWRTRFGGTASNCIIQSICTDKNGYIYIGGFVNSGSGFPILNNGANGTYGGGTNDAFVAKFDTHPNFNALLWSTYYGGSGADHLNGIAVDGNGNVVITGFTDSPNTSFPLVDELGTSYYQGTFGGGTFDAFVAGFQTNGTLAWSTYYGDTDNEKGTNVAIDSDNNAYVIGTSNGSNIPIPSPNLTGGYNQAYIASDESFLLTFNKFHHPIWGTYYGGDGNDIPYGIDTYGNSRLIMVGQTNTMSSISPPYTTTFPLVNLANAYNQSTSLTYNSFIASFDLTPVILASTNELYNNNNELLIYPNPSNEFINISINLLKGSNIKISIFNFLGQEIFFESIKNIYGDFTKNIAIKNIANGVYIISVAIDDRFISKKIIKK